MLVCGQSVNTDGEALKNWKNPGSFDATLINAPAFVSLEGFTGNGTSSYINTGWVPSTDGVNYTKDDAGFEIYIRTNVDEARYDLGVKGGANWLAIEARASDVAYLRMNDDTWSFDANTDSRGFFIGNRTASNVLKLYKNDIEIVAGVGVTTNLPGRPVYILCLNSDGVATGFGTKQVACVSFGASLSGAERTAYKNALETYMDSNSKGVIT